MVVFMFGMVLGMVIGVGVMCLVFVNRDLNKESI